MKKIYNISNQFSIYPCGRYKTDGPYSAQRLRDELLQIINSSSCTELHIELDGTRGLSNPFLEELFGGMIRVSSVKTIKDVWSKIKLISNNNRMIETCSMYALDEMYRKGII